jgi:hypothetical protein
MKESDGVSLSDWRLNNARLSNSIRLFGLTQILVMSKFGYYQFQLHGRDSNMLLGWVRTVTRLKIKWICLAMASFSALSYHGFVKERHK